MFFIICLLYYISLIPVHSYCGCNFTYIILSYSSIFLLLALICSSLLIFSIWLLLVSFGCFECWVIGISIIVIDIINIGFILLLITLIPLLNWLCCFECCNINFSIIIMLLVLFMVLVLIIVNILLFFIIYELLVILLFILIYCSCISYYKIRVSFYLFGVSIIGSIGFIIGFIVLFIGNYSLLSFLIIIPFYIKVPCYPFYYWLIEVHAESNTVISVYLASLLLKLGVYGIIRFIICSFWVVIGFLNSILLSIVLVGIIIISCTLWRNYDIKKIIAFGSIIHLNIIIGSLCSLSLIGIIGSILTCISHGYCVSGLFVFSGLLISKTYCRNLDLLYFIDSSYLFLGLILSNIGFPGSISFISEFIVLMSIWLINYWICVIIGLLSISFCLFWLIVFNRKLYYNGLYLSFKDIEIGVLIWFNVVIWVIGVWLILSNCYMIYSSNDSVFNSYRLMINNCIFSFNRLIFNIGLFSFSVINMILFNSVINILFSSFISVLFSFYDYSFVYGVYNVYGCLLSNGYSLINGLSFSINNCSSSLFRLISIYYCLSYCYCFNELVLLSKYGFISLIGTCSYLSVSVYNLINGSSNINEFSSYCLNRYFRINSYVFNYRLLGFIEYSLIGSCFYYRLIGNNIEFSLIVNYSIYAFIGNSRLWVIVSNRMFSNDSIYVYRIINVFSSIIVFNIIFNIGLIGICKIMIYGNIVICSSFSIVSYDIIFINSFNYSFINSNSVIRLDYRIYNILPFSFKYYVLLFIGIKLIKYLWFIVTGFIIYKFTRFSVWYLWLLFKVLVFSFRMYRWWIIIEWLIVSIIVVIINIGYLVIYELILIVIDRFIGNSFCCSSSHHSKNILCSIMDTGYMAITDEAFP